MGNQKINLAAIDIGTNSFHLVIAEVDALLCRFRTLVRDKEIVRLGSGTTDMKYITDEAMTRGLGVLKRFSNLAQTYGAPVRAIATSAIREALNQDEFIRRARIEAGVTVEIASGAEEARLIQLGVLQALPVIRKRILLLDVGGGSTEILIGRGRRIHYSNSIKLGAVRLMLRFFPAEVVNRKAIAECRKYIKGMLWPIVRDIKSHPYDLVVGTSGTMMNLASIIRLHSVKNPDTPLNGFTIQADDLQDATENILKHPTSAGRLHIAGLDPKRADIIPAGAILASEIFKELGIRELTISDFALREGVLLDSIEKLHPRRASDPLHDLRYKSAIHLAENCRYEKKHSHQVTRLALSLFQQTQRLHNLGEEEREFLESAALLHEIGLFVSHESHHRHSYYLIRNAELAGFTENEKAIIANVARYHRKSHPKLKHEGFRILSQKDRTTVAKLASLLRIADGLDRSHSTAIDRVRVRLTSRHVYITACCRRKRDTTLEQWGVERNQVLFEETFNMRVSVNVRQ
jgi:exopolyphosphatase/guanosine-5'-triphosphate,3'-diphosphate pyrophosphatase